jgi:hypothetical protein
VRSVWSPRRRSPLGRRRPRPGSPPGRRRPRPAPRPALRHTIPMAAGVGRERVGDARASPVKDDQPAKRCQRATEQRDPGVFPGDVQVTKAPGGQHEVGWPFAERLIGNPVLAEPRVPGLWVHGPSRHRGPRGILGLGGAGPVRGRRSALLYLVASYGRLSEPALDYQDEASFPAPPAYGSGGWLLRCSDQPSLDRRLGSPQDLDEQHPRD